MNEFNLTAFFGRFHPVLVHLPIGILLLAFLFEILSKTKKYGKLRVAVRPCLFYGMISAILAVGSGYYLSLEGGYDTALLNQHKWMGFLTAGLAFLIYLFKRNAFGLEKDDRKMAVFVLFFPLTFLLTLTGHLGGSLTHGEGYLLEHTPAGSARATAAPLVQKLAVSDIGDAQVYRDLVEPVLASHCYGCHGAKKQKGQLRLDKPEYVLKGGKEGQVIKTGNSNDSELFKRISLSIEEEDHMPPRKEAQLHASEIELIRWWIDEGASFESSVLALKPNPELEAYFKSLLAGAPAQSWLPENPVAAADANVLKKLRSEGISVVPVSVNSNYLSVSFTGKKQINPGDFELLKAIALQLVSLNLGRTLIADDDIAQLAALKNLRRLHLDHTGITDKGLDKIPSDVLVYLNLVGTQVTNAGVKTLARLKSLKELYIFDTRITAKGVGQLDPGIRVDTGRYNLPRLVTDTLVYTVK